MTGGSGFLYPFLDDAGRDASALLADLAASAGAKAEESRRLAAATIGRLDDALDAAAPAVAARFAAGGRLLAFGNGGSATDAQRLAALFARPPDGRPLPARSLVDDVAVLTALANDVGYELVFARQIIAHAHDGDIAVGLSTSGSSPNLLAAFTEAHRRGLLTVGFAGYTGGAMAASDVIDHCLVVRSESVHRIQEAQAALTFALWSRVQAMVPALVGDVGDVGG